MIYEYDIEIDRTNKYKLVRVGGKKVTKEIVEYPEDAFRIINEFCRLGYKGEENCYIFAMNGISIMGVFLIQRETMDNCGMNRKNILSRLLLIGASGCIIMHNHPSQIAKPSKEDFEMFEELKKSFELMDITIIDFMLICKYNFYSFLNHDIIE